jgi:predicted alpha/beta hydrolase family esterase
MELADWRNVHCQDWVSALEIALFSLNGDAVLVAHSLGCLATAWWAAAGSPGTKRVRAAMLVAPPDLASAPGCLPALSSFTPVPRRKLPWPTLLVASETDPYASIAAAAQMAEDWGSVFLNAGAAGHINADSGLEEWPAGERHLADFLCMVHLAGLWGPETTGEPSIRSAPGTRYIV